MKNKTLLKTLLLAVTAFFALLLSAHAQSPSVSDAFATMDENSPNVFTGTFTVMLSDTVSISQIEVKLGTSSSASDITLQTFDYDVTSGFSNGRSYNRADNKVVLGIGDFSEKNTYFGEARIKDTSGNWSSAYRFIFN
jgi:hypothetical protein